MNCDAMEQPAASVAYPLLKRFLAFFPMLRARRRSAASLDIEAMPDRMKRDLGFLDGREPRYEDPLRR